MRRSAPPLVVLLGCAVLWAADLDGQVHQAAQFRADIALVNLTVTVTDAAGRFVPNLTRSDFVVYEDGRPQPLVHFIPERTPVSLGLVVDASGSMAGDKMDAARGALRRFTDELLGPDDELFLVRFNEVPQQLLTWTRDRAVLQERIAAIRPNGGTALYDAVFGAVGEAQRGTHRKKAVVVISDGNDTHSRGTAADVVRKVRETEVLVYAVGIDSEEEGPRRLPPAPPRRRWPGRVPMPVPGGQFPRRPPLMPPTEPTVPVPPQPWPPMGGAAAPRDDRVNVAALRAMTDDSGGRTELIRTAADLDPATASIADELSRQYTLTFAPASPTRDGRWHTIRIEVRNHAYHVRARKGYVY